MPDTRPPGGEHRGATSERRPVQRLGNRAAVGGVGLGLVAAILGGLWVGSSGPTPNPASPAFPTRSGQFDGQQAYEYLAAICSLGPRITGSLAMRQQQDLLARHFEALGATVVRDDFEAVQPSRPGRFPCTNLVVHWHPDAVHRVLIGCHYDTRPMADEEPVARNRTKPFLGANDGASGAALLMELGRCIPGLELRVGVDFVFFDAEEYILDRARDRYFIGSEQFVRQYQLRSPAHRYEAVVVVDMIGDRDLQIHPDQRSAVRAGRLVEEVFGIAREFRLGQFDPRPKHDVRDDHLAFQDAGIPAMVLIDFDYPHWHRLTDTPDRCSPQSLRAVGMVLIEWLLRRRPVGAD